MGVSFKPDRHGGYLERNFDDKPIFISSRRQKADLMKERNLAELTTGDLK